MVAVAEQVVPVIKGKPITGIETTDKTTGTQYKIITVDSGVINQAVLFNNKETQQVTFVSKT